MSREFFVSSLRPPCVLPLEPRTLLSGTVDLPVVNPGFDILYQPGSTTVTATLTPGELTEGFGTNRPVEKLADSSIATVSYSDGAKGHNVDVPGWEMAPKQGPNPHPVAAVINNPAAYQGKADNFASILFPPDGGGLAFIEQTLPGVSLQPDTTYVLSAQVADGGTINLHAGGKNVTAARTSRFKLGSSSFSTLVKTFVTHAKVPAGDLGIVLANGISTLVGTFDNVSLTATSKGSAPTPTPTPTPASPGTFGLVNGRIQKATLTEADRTKVTFSLTGGTGTATQAGDQVQLQISTTSPAAVLSVTTKGGSRRVSLGDVTVAGSLKSFKAPAADLSGTLSVSGTVGDLTLGNVTGNVSTASIGKLTAAAVGGTLFSNGSLQSAKLGAVTGAVVASGAIGTLTAQSLAGATILSGAGLGADGLPGSTGAAADTYGTGSIASLSVTGAVTGNTVVAAGANPEDGVFGNGNDAAADAGAGAIRSISVRGNADPAARFEAGAFGKVRVLNKKLTSLTGDPRFVVLA